MQTVKTDLQGRPQMKYTKRKAAALGSLAAAEVKAVLRGQNSPLGNKEAAEMIGVNYETVRAVVNDSRIPSIGIIYGLARSLKLDDQWVEYILALREKDLVRKKLSRAVSSLSGSSDVENLVTILGTLNKSQIQELKKNAISLAIADRLST